MTMPYPDAPDPMEHVTTNPAGFSHIEISSDAVCLDDCKARPCTYICPSQVYSWTGDHVHVDYERCIECTACSFSCPENNLDWDFPPAGHGVRHRY